MKEDRIKFFSKLTLDEKYNLSSKDFTVSEIAEIISETALSDEDIKIATLRYIKDCTIAKIAEEVGLDEKTVQRRLPKISDKLKKTLQKIL